jgi:hypothetical protein
MVRLFLLVTFAHGISLSEFSKKLITTETEDYTLGPVAIAVGLPRETRFKGNEVLQNEATDKLDHSINIAISGSSQTITILQTTRLFSGSSEHYVFRVSPDETLEKAFVSRGKRDIDNRPIRGSAVVTPLNINSPTVKKRLQHELDFWLRQAYRKQRPRQKH